MSGVKYPTRCQIVDVTGGKVGPIPIHTPTASVPHLGKLGVADMVHGEHDGDFVRIYLDDGATLDGCECWWVPLTSDEEAPAPVAW